MPIDPIDKTQYVYGLVDDDDRLRYIGCTAYPAQRRSSHRIDARGSGTAFYRWLRETQIELEFVVLEEVPPGKSGFAVERQWIALALEAGEPLFNSRDNPAWEAAIRGRGSTPEAARQEVNRIAKSGTKLSRKS